MPPLLCLSPRILDNSFPRSQEELIKVCVALGELNEYFREEKAFLIVTDLLKLFIEDFDWSQGQNNGLLSVIHSLLDEWFLNTKINTDDFGLGTICPIKYPIPRNITSTKYVELWCEEVGKLLVKHDEYCRNNEFFIGVACENAFSGNGITEYENPDNLRVFPFIGPLNLSILDDAFIWDVSENDSTTKISINTLIRNYKFLGEARLEKPHRDDHCHIYFGQYRWQFSLADDPIPDAYLKELIPILKVPLPVIKHILINQTYPLRKLKIH